MGIIRTQVKLLIFLPYLIGSTHHVTAKLDLPLVIFGPIGSNEIEFNVDFRKYTNDFDINTSERTAIIEYHNGILSHVFIEWKWVVFLSSLYLPYKFKLLNK